MQRDVPSLYPCLTAIFFPNHGGMSYVSWRMTVQRLTLKCTCGSRTLPSEHLAFITYDTAHEWKAAYTPEQKASFRRFKCERIVGRADKYRVEVSVIVLTEQHGAPCDTHPSCGRETGAPIGFCVAGLVPRKSTSNEQDHYFWLVQHNLHSGKCTTTVFHF